VEIRQSSSLFAVPVSCGGQTSVYFSSMVRAAEPGNEWEAARVFRLHATALLYLLVFTERRLELAADDSTRRALIGSRYPRHYNTIRFETLLLLAASPLFVA
jgi:hypothetical protein